MAHTLQSRTPDLDLLLLECTNLSPFKRDLRQSTRLPVFDLVDALMWIHEAAAVRWTISDRRLVRHDYRKYGRPLFLSRIDGGPW